MERMGGLSVLLEFIGRCLDSSHRACVHLCSSVFTFWRGLICADAGAGYAAQLPFGLPEVGFFQGLAVSDGRLRSGGHGGVELLICAGSRSVSLWRFSRFGAINISPTVRCSFSGSVAGVVTPIASSYWGFRLYGAAQGCSMMPGNPASLRRLSRPKFGDCFRGLSRSSLPFLPGTPSGLRGFHCPGSQVGGVPVYHLSLRGSISASPSRAGVGCCGILTL